MVVKTPDYAAAAIRHLKRADPVLADIIGKVGPFELKNRPERFQALVRAIIFQQLAGRAAQTIFDRFVGLFPDVRFPSPEVVIAASDEDLRRIGLSRQKAAYIKDLAGHIKGRSLSFHRFPRMDDEEIIADLVRVKGIGRWTAEMFLMFNLGRPDVMPADDLGVQNAIKRHYRMRQRPNRKRLLKHAERWRPYRTAAAWYLWRSLDIVLPDGGAKQTTKKVAKRKQR